MAKLANLPYPGMDFTPLDVLTADELDQMVSNIEAVASVSSVVDLVYPVGSIYMSATLSTAAQVGSALGGTWVAWGSGRVPVGVNTGDTDFDTAEETGGSKTHNHTLGAGYAKLNIKGSGEIPYREKSVASWTSNYKANSDSGGSDSQSSSYGIELGGNTDNGSTLQPYITCYMYKRTA